MPNKITFSPKPITDSAYSRSDTSKEHQQKHIEHLKDINKQIKATIDIKNEDLLRRGPSPIYLEQGDGLFMLQSSHETNVPCNYLLTIGGTGLSAILFISYGKAAAMLHFKENQKEEVINENISTTIKYLKYILEKKFQKKDTKPIAYIQHDSSQDFTLGRTIATELEKENIYAKIISVTCPAGQYHGLSADLGDDGKITSFTHSNSLKEPGQFNSLREGDDSKEIHDCQSFLSEMAWEGLIQRGQAYLQVPDQISSSLHYPREQMQFQIQASKPVEQENSDLLPFNLMGRHIYNNILKAEEDLLKAEEEACLKAEADYPALWSPQNLLEVQSANNVAWGPRKYPPKKEDTPQTNPLGEPGAEAVPENEPLHVSESNPINKGNASTPKGIDQSKDSFPLFPSSESRLSIILPANTPEEENSVAHFSPAAASPDEIVNTPIKQKFEGEKQKPASANFSLNLTANHFPALSAGTPRTTPSSPIIPYAEIASKTPITTPTKKEKELSLSMTFNAKQTLDDATKVFDTFELNQTYSSSKDSNALKQLAELLPEMVSNSITKNEKVAVVFANLLNRLKRYNESSAGYESLLTAATNVLKNENNPFPPLDGENISNIINGMQNIESSSRIPDLLEILTEFLQAQEIKENLNTKQIICMFQGLTYQTADSASILRILIEQIRNQRVNRGIKLISKAADIAMIGYYVRRLPAEAAIKQAILSELAKQMPAPKDELMDVKHMSMLAPTLEKHLPTVTTEKIWSGLADHMEDDRATLDGQGIGVIAQSLEGDTPATRKVWAALIEHTERGTSLDVQAHSMIAKARARASSKFPAITIQPTLTEASAPSLLNKEEIIRSLNRLRTCKSTQEIEAILLNTANAIQISNFTFTAKEIGIIMQSIQNMEATGGTKKLCRVMKKPIRDTELDEQAYLMTATGIEHNDSQEARDIAKNLVQKITKSDIKFSAGKIPGVSLGLQNLLSTEIAGQAVEAGRVIEESLAFLDMLAQQINRPDVKFSAREMGMLILSLENCYKKLNNESFWKEHRLWRLLESKVPEGKWDTQDRGIIGSCLYTLKRLQKQSEAARSLMNRIANKAYADFSIPKDKEKGVTHDFLRKIFRVQFDSPDVDLHGMSHEVVNEVIVPLAINYLTTSSQEKITFITGKGSGTPIHEGKMFDIVQQLALKAQLRCEQDPNNKGRCSITKPVTPQPSSTTLNTA